MKEVTIKIKKVTVLEGFGPDKITIDIEGTSPFPVMDYNPYFSLECTAGYGSRWVANNLGIEANVIRM